MFLISRLNSHSDGTHSLQTKWCKANATHYKHWPFNCYLFFYGIPHITSLCYHLNRCLEKSLLSLWQLWALLTANTVRTEGHCYLTSQIYSHCLLACFKCLGFADTEFANVCFKFLSRNFGERDWFLSELDRLHTNFSVLLITDYMIIFLLMTF